MPCDLTKNGIVVSTKARAKRIPYQPPSLLETEGDENREVFKEIMKTFKIHTLPHLTNPLYQHLRCISALSSALMSIINDTH